MLSDEKGFGNCMGFDAYGLNFFRRELRRATSFAAASASFEAGSPDLTSS
jgi:hypothetical protein